jgi:hypothetical protein
MNTNNKKCDPIESAGVDLNRNYGYEWGYYEGEKEDKGANECNELYIGKAAFSEKETQVMRDFLTANKDSIDLVYNLHCFGNMFVEPINAHKVIDAEKFLPKTMNFFNNLVKETKFPEDYKIGPT